MDCLQIDCEHLISIPTGIRINTNVIFKPTSQTRERIRDAHGLGEYMTIRVKDASGDSVSKRLCKVISIIDERGTIIAVTQEL